MKKIFSLFLLLHFTYTQAQIKLPKLISNGMVLQRDTKVNIWGWSSPKESITITFQNKQYNTIATDSGAWKIVLPPHKAGGPYQLFIQGKNEIVIEDVLLGDVWLCSGQSNMELEMERLKYKYAQEVATVNNTKIRQFTVPDKYNFNAVQTDVDYGNWITATKNNILKFSGVAYFFAKQIYEKHKVPIGLINSALGGSPAEAWIDEESVKQFPNYYKELQQYKSKIFRDSIEQTEKKAIDAWYAQLNKTDEGLQQNWKANNLDVSDWKEMNIPGYWADETKKITNGVVWFRKTFTAPASMLKQNIKVELGRIVDADSVFINGKFVGNITYQYPPRRYEVDGSYLQEGINTIVVRVVNNSGKGGFVLDKRYEITTATDTIALTGLWKYKQGCIMPPTPPTTFIRWKPVGLYNNMVHPLINYNIKGVIWYQGEANTKNPPEYLQLMQTLIANWRSKWQQNFPFLFVQLANFMEEYDTPTESNWAATRMAQLNTLLQVPNTGMAVITDIGDWNDIHPENKLDVGVRLALWARKIVYGEKNIVVSGPIIKKAVAKNNRIELSFNYVGSGLVCKGNALQEFAVAGANKKFVWASANIKNNTVIIENPLSEKVMYVRYAWQNNPAKANLYNKEGLPASCFEVEVK